MARAKPGRTKVVFRNVSGSGNVLRVGISLGGVRLFLNFLEVVTRQEIIMFYLSGICLYMYLHVCA